MNIEHLGQDVLRIESRKKGKLAGAKPPLQPKHVWAIRTRLQIAGRTRDLALFNLAIDSKLRGCDLVSIAVEDVAPHGSTARRSVSARQADRSGSRSQNRPARRSMIFWRRLNLRRATIFSEGSDRRAI
jgi:hypothetical protein